MTAAERIAARYDDRVAGLTPEVRAELAEYHVLAVWDLTRSGRYGDMARSRRERELNRRGDRLIDLRVPITRDGEFPPSTRDEIRAAFARVIVPRWRRFAHEPGVAVRTKHARATAQCYALCAARLGCELPEVTA